MPKISIIMPLYNHEKYLAEAINSVLEQTYQDFELLIIDDGSDDNSVEIVKSFTDPRISLFCLEENRGVSSAMNRGLAEAAGRYIAVLDSDDIFMPDKLEKQLTYLEEHNNIGAVFCLAILIDENANDFKDKSHPYFNIFKHKNRNRFEWLNYFFHHGNCLGHPGVLIRKECFNKIGNYNERLYQMPDFDLWIRLCMSYDIHVMDKKLFKYRIRDNEKNISGQSLQAKTRLDYEFTKVLNNFNELDKESLLKVFPDLDRKEVIGEDLIPYIIAAKALKIDRLSYRLFAIDTLYDLLNKREIAKKIEDSCGFTYRDFIKLTGDNRVFALPFVLEKEKEKNKKLKEELAELYNSNSWKLTEPLRKIRFYFRHIIFHFFCPYIFLISFRYLIIDVNHLY